MTQSSGQQAGQGLQQKDVVRRGPIQPSAGQEMEVSVDGEGVLEQVLDAADEIDALLDLAENQVPETRRCGCGG